MTRDDWGDYEIIKSKLIFDKEIQNFLKIFRFYLQSGERLEVVESPRVDGADLVHVEVQLGGLGWDSLQMKLLMKS